MRLCDLLQRRLGDEYKFTNKGIDDYSAMTLGKCVGMKGKVGGYAEIAMNGCPAQAQIFNGQSLEF